ncbi:MAG TPA: hypothetical protein VGL89_00390 [Candidatus Koribacter sp.]|jgi:YVTN family beta-propeller protein
MFPWKKAGMFAGVICAMIIGTACGDYYRPTANPIIAPGGNPQNTHFAYALYSNPNGPGGTTGPGTLQQIDVSGDSVTLQVIVGREPIFASFYGTSTGAVYTVNKEDGSVTQQSFLSVQPPNVITLPTRSAPVFVGGTSAVDVYILNASAPDQCTGTGSLNIVTTGNVVSNTICVGQNPVALGQKPNGGKIYVVNQATNNVSVVDPVSQQVGATIPVGSNPVWITSNLDGSYMFVVNKGSNSLTAIHTTDNTTTTIPVGTAPNFSIFDSFRNRLYVTNGGSNDVSMLDLSKATPQMLVQHVSLGAGTSNPTSIVPLADGSRYYVANSGSFNVSVVNSESNTLAATTPNPIPLYPAGTTAATAQNLWIESEPTSAKVYVTTPPPSGTPQSNNPNAAPGVTIIRTSNNSIESFLQAPQSDPNCQPNPVAIPPVTCGYQTPVQLLTYIHD